MLKFFPQNQFSTWFETIQLKRTMAKASESSLKRNLCLWQCCPVNFLHTNERPRKLTWIHEYHTRGTGLELAFINLAVLYLTVVIIISASFVNKFELFNFNLLFLWLQISSIYILNDSSGKERSEIWKCGPVKISIYIYNSFSSLHLCHSFGQFSFFRL